jgi:hypothetical protein
MVDKLEARAGQLRKEVAAAKKSKNSERKAGEQEEEH